MILEKNNLQTVQAKSELNLDIELIALYVHPKNSNHLRSHSRAIIPAFGFFKDELEARKSLKAFFYSQNYN